jgi:hypothetical protein
MRYNKDCKTEAHHVKYWCFINIGYQMLSHSIVLNSLNRYHIREGKIWGEDGISYCDHFFLVHPVSGQLEQTRRGTEGRKSKREQMELVALFVISGRGGWGCAIRPE